MKETFVWIATALLLVAGGHLTCSATSSIPTYLNINAHSDDGKHTAKYIRQRVDDIYSCYKNPQYDEYGMRIIERGDLNDTYCSSRYKALYQKAYGMSEGEMILDYDHWTGSQDDNQFTYRVGKIENITDSTATAYVEGKNFGEDYTIALSLYFERGDWYVDDFLSDDETEKDYLEKVFHQLVGDKIVRFYEDYVFYGKDDLTTEEAVVRYCTPRLARKLKDAYEYDGEGYAIWDFRGPQHQAGDSDAHHVDAVTPKGDGLYQVEYTDGGQKLSCTVSVIVEGSKVLFDDIK